MIAWFDDIPTLYAFERAARRELGGLQRSDTPCPRKLVYELDVDVPGYNISRRARIEFRATPDVMPRVLVDGPDDSPHRYGDGSLCMYHPLDPCERRWVPGDGLAALIDTIRVHLFQEEDARRGHGWSGDEAPHGPPSAARPTKRRKRRKRRR